MGDSFDTVPLSEIVDPDRGISYGIVQPGQHMPDGVPIIRVTDIRNGRVDSGAPLRVAPDIAAKYKRAHLRGGELLLTLVDTVGETAVVPPALEGWNTARAVAVVPVLPDPGPRWVQYALATGPAREYIDTRLNTTVQSTLNLRDVSAFPVPMPTRPVRDAVLHILGTLDDKIELNRRMNETLEAMARALFKSWFVDVVMPKDIAGRRVSTDSIARIREADAERLSKHRLQPGDLVYSRRGDVERHALIENRETGWLCGTGCLLVRLGPAWPSPAFASLALDRPEARAWISQHAVGATMPNLNTSILSAVPLVVPSDDLLAAFDREVDRLEQLHVTRDAESVTLGRLRDALLPRLLSGELSVAQAEQVAEATA